MYIFWKTHASREVSSTHINHMQHSSFENAKNCGRPNSHSVKQTLPEKRKRGRLWSWSRLGERGEFEVRMSESVGHSSQIVGLNSTYAVGGRVSQCRSIILDWRSMVSFNVGLWQAKFTQRKGAVNLSTTTYPDGHATLCRYPKPNSTLYQTLQKTRKMCRIYFLDTNQFSCRILFFFF